LKCLTRNHHSSIEGYRCPSNIKKGIGKKGTILKKIRMKDINKLIKLEAERLKKSANTKNKEKENI